MRLGIFRIVLGAALIVLQIMSWIGNVLGGGYGAVPLAFNSLSIGYSIGYYVGSNIAIIVGAPLLFFGIMAFVKRKVYINSVDDLSTTKSKALLVFLYTIYIVSFLNSLKDAFLYNNTFIYLLQSLLMCTCYALIVVYAIFHAGRKASALLSSSLIVIYSLSVLYNIPHLLSLRAGYEMGGMYIFSTVFYFIVAVISLVASIMLFYGVKRKVVSICFWVSFGIEAVLMLCPLIEIMSTVPLEMYTDGLTIRLCIQRILDTLINIAFSLALPLYITFVPQKKLNNN